MADLINLSEYKALAGVQPADTRNDAQITALLPGATRAIRQFTGRSFDVVAGGASARTFQYDGSGMLDIDDCASVVSVSTDGGVPSQSIPLTTDEWTAMPQDDSDVIWYLLIHGGPRWGGISPEMGFERNLDQYPISYKPPIVTVTATWGWPSVPDDVKIAAMLTVQEFLSSGSAGRGGEGLTSEAIEGWSRSWGGRTGEMVALAIPNKARDLLVSYQRTFA